MNHDSLSALLDEMSCLIHPSVEETFGNILLEAMSRCVPCISGKDAEAVPDVLGQGKNSIICDIMDAGAIYEAMLQMNNDDVYERIQRDATGML